MPYLYGQSAQEHFGKNRIQYKKFKWKYLSSYNFDIYYYEEGLDVAKLAVQYAEEEHARISDYLSYTPYSKIKIIVYNSLNDLQQSNIGLSQQDVFIGGQTDLVKSKVEIAFGGSRNEFRKEISNKVAEIFAHLMLYGSSFRDMLQSSYFITLPEWYISGLSAYVTEPWSVSSDNQLRDIFLNTKVKDPSTYSAENAKLIGQSVWYYMEQVYSPSSVTNTVNLTRIMRNDESGIEGTLGISYESFIDGWKDFFMSRYKKDDLNFKQVDDSYLLFKKIGKEKSVNKVSLSPDNKYLLYTINYHGRYKIVLFDIKKGKKNVIERGGYKRSDQQIDLNNPLINWKSDSVISYILYKRGELCLVLRDIKSNKSKVRKLEEFNQVLSFDISDDGNYFLFSAEYKSQSDIYLLDFQKNRVTNLTNDVYNDFTPHFIKGSYDFVFSSDKKIETDTSTQHKITAGFRNIFLYRQGKVEPLTIMNDNWLPKENGGYIYFLSDRKGIHHLYKYDLDNGTTIQLTQNIQNIEDYDLKGRYFSFIETYKNNNRVYLDTSYAMFAEENLTLNTSFLNGLLKKYPFLNKDGGVDHQDSITESNISFDINTITFSSDAEKNKDKLISTSKTKKAQINYTGPYRYKYLFSTNQVTSSLKIDPLRGLGVLLESSMSDMMSDHRINLGIFGLTDLKSSNLFGQYDYLKQRTDFRVRYDRETFFAVNESLVIQRYTLNKLAVSASYPVSVHSKFIITPLVANTRYSELTGLGSVYVPDQTYFYQATRLEYVFDNTLVYGLNMRKGTRLKIAVDQYYNHKNSSKDFGSFTFDFRNYQPIHKEFIFATRISHGQFFGNSPKNFLLGGMDNWWFNKSEQHSLNDPLVIANLYDNSDLLFTRFVTSMRGFKYNRQFGPKYLLINGEFRLPIVKYLYKGVINSTFFRNLQLISFTDIGSAWSGSNPFGKDNNTNTKYIVGNPFSAVVTNYRSPFLVGYGVGARTLFLGYYMKLDIAWGLSDGKTKGPIYYFTFGYDF